MKKNFTSLLLALALCVSCLSACAAPETSEKDPAPADTPETDEPPVDNTPAEPDPASVQGVARLGELVGNYAMPSLYDSRNSYVFVDTESDHNPYDLTWRYGPEEASQKKMDLPEWDDLYESYVEVCDWSLVFDADDYKKAFPMLAKLYHENDAEHNLQAHDWTTGPAYARDVDDVLWRLSRDHFAENTVKWHGTGTKAHGMFATYYANSEIHYEAMVSEEFYWFGCSNPYWSDNPDNPLAKNGNTGCVCQFDLFTEVQPHTPYKLD